MYSKNGKEERKIYYRLEIGWSVLSFLDCMRICERGRSENRDRVRVRG